MDDHHEEPAADELEWGGSFSYSISAFRSLPGESRRLAIFLLSLLPGIVAIMIVIAVWPERVDSEDASGPSGQEPTAVFDTPTDGTPTYGVDTAPSESGSPAADAALSRVTELESLLDQMGADRGQVTQAVEDVQACGTANGIQADAATLTNAAQSRTRLAESVAQLDLSAVTRGAEASGHLVAALRASALADQSFAAWAEAMSASCKPSSTTRNGRYKEAVSAGEKATAEKESFVEIWNDIALQYGLKQRQATGI